MDIKIILIYCICSDFLKRNIHYIHDFQHMSDEEVLTFSIVSAMFFFGNHERTRLFLYEYGYMPNILSKSQLNRRLHSFDEFFWRQLSYQLSQTLLHYEKTHEYAIDSFPVSACDTPRINRAKIFQGKEYHGYSPTKQRYFFGIKVHMLVSANKGIPIEIIFTPGSENDMKAFKRFSLDIPKGSTIYGNLSL
jgi:Transposase DDE domain